MKNKNNCGTINIINDKDAIDPTDNGSQKYVLLNHLLWIMHAV